jgi:hypothetical protein
MNKPIVISFYTLGTPYEEEVKKLIHSCLQFDIESDIVGVGSKGSWEKNCAIKSFFILEKLKEWDRPVLWVDADAVFLQPPDFSQFESCDFAVRVNEFLPRTNASRIVSNTIFVRNNAAAEAVLEKWCAKTQEALNDQQRVLEFWDQAALRDALEECPDLKFLPMPLKFAKIFDFDDLFISEQEIVIEHYQASRRHKHAFSQHHCCH